MKNMFLLFNSLFIGHFSDVTGQSANPDVAYWRFVVQTQNQELPFLVEIKKNNDKTFAANLMNGIERLPFDEVIFTDNSLTLNLFLFNTSIILKREGTDWSGKWIRYGYTPEYELPVMAYPNNNQRFIDTGEKASADFSGKWSVQFYNPQTEEKQNQAIGVFEQQGNKILGTFLTSTGDYRYLEGIVFNNTFQMSAFDGSHAYLFEGKLTEKGDISGNFWSGKAGYKKWIGMKNDTAQLPDAEKLTYIKEGYDGIDFKFPNVNGQLVTPKDDIYKGKVLIVQILGTWCPNCMDETAFLSIWYQQNAKRGVEIIGLAYEISPDFEVAKERIKKMKDRFQIGYECLYAGTNNNEEAAKTLPMLNKIISFPTTIIIDKKGQVRHIHTGFSGPGTGEYYTEFVDKFNTWMDELIAE